MSTEITLFAPNAQRDALCKHVKSLAFKPCGHLWPWAKGARHFHLFEATDWLSYDGVEATVYPASDEEKANHPGVSWCLHTRTRASASPWDKAAQNELIRSARQSFGGRFYNDWHGWNRYTPTYTDGRDPVSRGIYLVYVRITSDLHAVKAAIPPSAKQFESLEESIPEIASLDPSRALNNALVPFALAALEGFFKSAFKVLISKDAEIESKLERTRYKATLHDVFKVQAGRQTLADLLADQYSFQSISSIHAAFKDWTDIDFWKTIRKRRKISGRVTQLDRHFEKLITFRHGIIHDFDVDRRLNRNAVIGLYDLALHIINEFVADLEDARNVPIRDESVYKQALSEGL